MGSGELVAVFYADSVVGAGVMRGDGEPLGEHGDKCVSDCRECIGGGGVFTCVKVFTLTNPKACVCAVFHGVDGVGVGLSALGFPGQTDKSLTHEAFEAGGCCLSADPTG